MAYAVSMLSLRWITLLPWRVSAAARGAAVNLRKSQDWFIHLLCVFVAVSGRSEITL